VFYYFKKLYFRLWRFTIILYCLAMADNSMRFCSKCGIKHEGPTGKRRCRRVQMVELEPVEVMVPELDASERGDDGSDASMANLLTIMPRFATRMDQQQEQLSSIQAALMSPAPESGAIPKRREAGAVPQPSCAQDSNIPSLQIKNGR
jgi:hypothetical protein